jgi:catechol 2,3-dioxygenase-like lactoylglutathione lyase family enzyme
MLSAGLLCAFASEFACPDQFNPNTPLAQIIEVDPMYPRITHICLSVANLEDCARFYQRYCQMEINQDRSVSGQGSMYLSEAGKKAGLILQIKSGGAQQTPADNDETHIGFSVESREIVDVLASMARAEGVMLYEPGEYLPNAYFCGIRDPNGNCVEFGFGQHAPPAA